MAVENSSFMPRYSFRSNQIEVTSHHFMIVNIQLLLIVSYTALSCSQTELIFFGSTVYGFIFNGEMPRSSGKQFKF